MAREKGEYTDVNGAIITATTTQSKTTLGYTPEQLNAASKEAGNVGLKTLITSAAVVAWQSPLKTLMLNFSKDGSYISASKVGMYGFVRGFWAAYTGSTMRSAYVIGAKNNRPSESMTESAIKEESLVKEEGMKTGAFRTKMGYVMSAALGEIIVTQIPESLSSLKKISGLLPANFKWYAPYNLYQLMSTGFVPRYCAGLVNFASLCIVEDRIAQTLSIKNKKVKHFTAGALSGVIAATCSYPFAVFKDYALVQATVNNGRLVNPSASSLIVDMVKQFRDNPGDVAKVVAKNTAIQWSLRSLLVAGTFGTIALVEEILGPEPLNELLPERFRSSSASNQHGFFGKSSPVVIEEVEATKDKSVEQRQTGPK